MKEVVEVERRSRRRRVGEVEKEREVVSMKERGIRSEKGTIFFSSSRFFLKAMMICSIWSSLIVS